MEIMDFCQKVKKNLAEEIGEEMTLSVKQITKNNGVVLHGITVSKDGMNISPNIYMDGLYAAYEGETFRAVMDKVRRIYKESKPEASVDMSFFLDYEKMKEKVVFKAVGYARNKELLRQIPHILFLDMALVFYCHVPQKELDSATILVYNSHLKMWGVTKERLYWDAQKNTPRILPARILSMEEMMKEICSVDEIGEGTMEDMEQTAEGNAPDSGFGKGGRMFVLGNEKSCSALPQCFTGIPLRNFPMKWEKVFLYCRVRYTRSFLCRMTAFRNRKNYGKWYVRSTKPR